MLSAPCVSEPDDHGLSDTRYENGPADQPLGRSTGIQKLSSSLNSAALRRETSISLPSVMVMT